ncbi:MAG: universal stress protein [Phycisphaeraceae bacterium]
MGDRTDTTPLLRTVLAPLALSPRAAAVACEARRWARLLGAELVLLHVGRDEPAVRSRFDDLLRQYDLTEHRLLFVPGAGAMPGAGAGKVIVRVAGELQADLIVAGALEKEGALSYYVGSVARRVARRAPCSVLLLTEPKVEAPLPRHWVVTVRPDQATGRMLRFLRSVSEREKPDRIEAVSEYNLTGIDWALESDLDARTAEAQRRTIHRQEQARLADFLMEAEFSDPAIRPICLAGRVGYESSEYARREGADLLIAPAPRRLGFWDKFIQHGVEFALESLPCALWLYRPNE